MLMTKQYKHLIDEADIGSGEKTPGQQETEKFIEEVGKDRKNNLPPQHAHQDHRNADETLSRSTPGR
jgi:hypothetical protein